MRHVREKANHDVIDLTVESGDDVNTVNTAPAPAPATRPTFIPALRHVREKVDCDVIDLTVESNDDMNAVSTAPTSATPPTFISKLPSSLMMTSKKNGMSRVAQLIYEREKLTINDIMTGLHGKQMFTAPDVACFPVTGGQMRYALGGNPQPDFVLNGPFKLLLSGPSGCGKTNAVAHLLQDPCVDTNFVTVYLISRFYQPFYRAMLQGYNVVQLAKFSDFDENNLRPNSCLILDDSAFQFANSANFCTLLWGSRHLDLSMIYDPFFV